ncbi:MAG TPA: flagellar hook-length control protein FliK [Noviherbaspirillum sp.]|nr:flagellar hook-length control protein FliK [Noviherbaspirillum sp.]
MNTPAISSTANILPGSSSGTKSPDASGDMAFGQVLSREMAARPKTAETAKPAVAENNKKTQATRSEAKSDSAKTTEDSAASSPEENSAAPASVDSNAAPEIDKSKASVDNASQEEDVTLSPASAELLALVTSLNQAAAGRTKSSEKTELSPEDASKRIDIDAEGATLQATVQAPDSSLAPQIAAANTTTNTGVFAPGQDTATTEQSVSSVQPDIARSNQSRRTGMNQAQEMTARSLATQEANSRTESDSAAKDIASEPKEFDARLTQARDEKPANENGRIDPLAQKPVLEMPTAKGSQETRQDAPSLINVGSLSASQQTQLRHTQAVPANTADRLAPQVGTPGWDQALGQKVVWMVGGEHQSASLTLNPPDLGPLQIELKVANSQATANFTAAQPEVRQALEAAMPKLREMLGEAGIQLGQANVSAGTPNQQNAFEQAQQSSRQSASMNEGLDVPLQSGRSQVISSGQGLVDTFA